jgi:sodium-dependent phosphate cotransporter
MDQYPGGEKAVFGTIISATFRLVPIVATLYLFLFSVGLLGSSLKLFGKGFAETLIAGTSNPLAGLFIGILATSIVQSSSMTTSILVGMVGGGILSVSNGIPIVMGANVGTTITNVLVSLTHIRRTGEFRRAFAAATVHDIFNLLSVALLFPLQYLTDFLGAGSRAMAGMFSSVGGMKLFNPLAYAIKPVVAGFLHLVNDSPLAGTIIAVILLFGSLHYMVKLLRSTVLVRLERFFQRYIFKTILRSFMLGLVLTVMVQSSSITTSVIVPLVASGVLTLVQVFPYTLGANLGTTVTAILAALATGNLSAVTIAFVHTLFNLSGIAIFLPLRAIPISMAEKLAGLAIKSRLVPILFVLFVFFIIPSVLIFVWR